MFEYVEWVWARYRLIIFKLMRDAVAPVSVAVLWGVFVAIEKGSKVDGLNAASLAFFLVLSFQNLIQRAAKVVRDEEHGEKVISRFDALEQSFDSLQSGLRELRAQGLKPPANVREPPSDFLPAERPLRHRTTDRLYQPNPPTPLSFAPYLDEAEQAAENGLYLAGALVAAVGFEATARDVAWKFDVPDRRMSLGALLRELSERTSDQSKMETLGTLNRIRNGLVHAEKQVANISREEALELIDAFRVGAAYLYDLPNN